MMKKVSSAALLLAAFGVLAGCEVDGTRDNQEFSTYDSLSTEYERIATEDGGTALTMPAALPTTGNAEYDGVINIIVQDGPAATDVLLSAVGGLELTVAFGARSGIIGGTADNFYRDDGTEAGVAVDGGGGIIDGEIDRSVVPGAGDSFVLELSSDFAVDGNALEGTLRGNFRDQSAPGAFPDGATGIVGGTVTDGPGTGFRGTWVAQNVSTFVP